jgi:hypothetical protein
VRPNYSPADMILEAIRRVHSAPQCYGAVPPVRPMLLPVPRPAVRLAALDHETSQRPPLTQRGGAMRRSRLVINRELTS